MNYVIQNKFTKLFISSITPFTSDRNEALLFLTYEAAEKELDRLKLLNKGLSGNIDIYEIRMR